MYVKDGKFSNNNEEKENQKISKLNLPLPSSEFKLNKKSSQDEIKSLCFTHVKRDIPPMFPTTQNTLSTRTDENTSLNTSLCEKRVEKPQAKLNSHSERKSISKSNSNRPSFKFPSNEMSEVIKIDSGQRCERCCLQPQCQKELEKWKLFSKLMADAYEEMNHNYQNMVFEKETEKKIIKALKMQVRLLEYFNL